MFLSSRQVLVRGSFRSGRRRGKVEELKEDEKEEGAGEVSLEEGRKSK